MRRLTKRKGVDVVFEHVGADTWNGSLLCLKRGGRLVTCGSTSGRLDHHEPDAAVPAAIPHHRLLRLPRSRTSRQSLDKMAGGMTPVIDAVFPLAEFQKGLERLESRKVFGKVVVTF